MNCLWLLILLCCSRNNNGNVCDWNNGNTFDNRRVEHDCCIRNDIGRNRCCDNDYERTCENNCNCESDRCHEPECDNLYERRNFIPFKNQTCGCENNNCQS